MTDFPVESERLTHEVVPQTRPMYRSVRRELWENRSLYLAPLFVAAAVQFGFMISTIGMPARRRAVLLLDPAKQRAAINMPYDVAATMLIVTAFIVGFFYCLDALYGERRDRSILFWKSLPVSDRTTVLAKAAIPFAVLPLYTFAVAVATQFTMLLLSSAVLLRSGLAGTTWTHFLLVPQSMVLLYSLIAITLWHAPIYAWLLMVSAWARRAAFLWAVLPAVGLSVLEKMAFNSEHFATLMGYRFMGFYKLAFIDRPRNAPPPADPLTLITPLHFFATPGLWFGLIVAAGFLAAAVRLRRNREPI